MISIWSLIEPNGFFIIRTVIMEVLIWTHSSSESVVFNVSSDHMTILICPHRRLFLFRHLHLKPSFNVSAPALRTGLVLRRWSIFSIFLPEGLNNLGIRETNWSSIKLLSTSEFIWFNKELTRLHLRWKQCVQCQTSWRHLVVWRNLTGDQTTTVIFTAAIVHHSEPSLCRSLNH